MAQVMHVMAMPKTGRVVAIGVVREGLRRERKEEGWRRGAEEGWQAIVTSIM